MIYNHQAREALTPEYRTIPAASTKLYASAIATLEPLMPALSAGLNRIGQGQLIRRQIAFTLQFGCQLDAHMLYQALDTFNQSMLEDIKQHYRNPDKYPYHCYDSSSNTSTSANASGIGTRASASTSASSSNRSSNSSSTSTSNSNGGTKGKNPLLVETTALLEACGLDDPLHKIYITSRPMEGLPVLLFLLLLTHLPKVL
jgi:WASH complex subunit strumpellin